MPVVVAPACVMAGGRMRRCVTGAGECRRREGDQRRQCEGACQEPTKVKKHRSVPFRESGVLHTTANAQRSIPRVPSLTLPSRNSSASSSRRSRPDAAVLRAVQSVGAANVRVSRAPSCEQEPQYLRGKLRHSLRRSRALPRHVAALEAGRRTDAGVRLTHHLELHEPGRGGLARTPGATPAPERREPVRANGLCGGSAARFPLRLAASSSEATFPFETSRYVTAWASTGPAANAETTALSTWFERTLEPPQRVMNDRGQCWARPRPRPQRWHEQAGRGRGVEGGRPSASNGVGQARADCARAAGHSKRRYRP